MSTDPKAKEKEKTGKSSFASIRVLKLPTITREETGF